MVKKMEAIKIINLNKEYKDVKALKNISFNIHENELFGLLGVNGAGKTTLIKILSGLISFNEGEAYIYNYSVKTDLNKIKEIVDVSPQETAVALNLTVKENLEFFKDIYNVSDENDINNLIKIFKFEEILNKKAKTLSGGYQRRLSIAVTLLSKPKVIFLDEPTLGLDVLARREIWNIIKSIKNKCTIVLTSHYLEEIEALCDRVAILAKGNLLKIGTVNEIKKETNKNTFEEAFISIVEEK